MVTLHVSCEMDPAKVRRIFALGVSVVILQLCELYAYEIPEVKIQAFTPKGFRASIPDAPNIGLFVFQGNVNRDIGNNDVGAISGEVETSSGGRWTFEAPDLRLKAGDVINYYVFVSASSVGYIKDRQSYTVTALEDPSAAPTPALPTAGPDCQPTATVVRAGGACAGQTIFEDRFDTLREDVWQIEQYIPVNHPEYPFVSYQRLPNNPTVSVVDGNLRIAPALQQNQPGFTNESIYSGNLNLYSGCTGTVSSECSAQAWGASILPPVVTGRVTSQFAFKYGTLHVRARLPQGDWLYPEILLEPLLKKYGNLNYASGVLKVASARGNGELNVGYADFGNKVLYGGAIMDLQCRQYLIHDKKMTDGKAWGDDFHVYSVKWTPERITLLVDMQEWARMEPVRGSLRGHFPPACDDLPQQLLERGSSIAPFDDFFYITLGVAAGGVTEFRDDVYSSGNVPKPWRNQARKASLNFWTAMDSWYPTWNNPQLLVDYVKVVAL